MTENQTFYDQATLYELQKWIENLCCEESCPIIDPQTHDIERLLKIKSRNEEAEKDAREIISANKKLTDFYRSKSLEMENTINSSGVSLNEDIMGKIESLSKLAVTLNLAEPDLTNFLLGISDMRVESSEQQSKKLENRHLLSCFSKKVVNIEKQNEILRKNLEELQKTVDRQNSTEANIKDTISVMSKKKVQYEQEAELHQHYLKKIKFQDTLKHNALFEKNEAIKAFEEEVKKKVNKLNSYKALPPNESLARIEVQKKKQELEDLTKKFTSMLEALESTNAENH